MITETQQQIINAVMAYPLPHVIARYARDYNLPYDVAERHVLELRRFFILCALNPGVHYGMKGQIDNVWHTFLLFTTEYHKFCNSVAGKFIHHYPDTSDEERTETITNYQNFLRDYEATFGEAPPPQFWPRFKDIEHTSNGCAGCKGCGVEYDGGDRITFSMGCEGCNGCRGCKSIDG
jgi:hypothetical protein